jgi:electron transfer flavoprotein beta subunit
LALGADSAIHVITDMRIDQDLQPLAVAKILAKIFKDKEFDLAILGKQAIDDDYNQTGQIMASILGVPSATFCSKIEIKDKVAEITREVDFGLQKLSVTLPAVFTCDLRLNTPRFAKVQNIVKANKKPVEVIELKSLGIDVEPRLTVVKVESPVERQGGVIVANVDELLVKLRLEAKVI